MLALYVCAYFLPWRGAHGRSSFEKLMSTVVHNIGTYGEIHEDWLF